jgi:hypothetical protein
LGQAGSGLVDGGGLVTDKHVRRLSVLVKTPGNQETAAPKAGMDAEIARKYGRLGKLPSELPTAPRWRNRPAPFIEVWGESCALLEINTGLEAKTVFQFLRRR